MNTILSFMLALTLISGAGCSSTEKNDNPVNTQEQNQTESVDAGSSAQASDIVNIKIIMEDGKEMTAELYPDIAPLSVANFVKLAEEDFFDGLIFHRVIEGFMIQGGGYDESFYDGNFNQKETEEIKGEFSTNGVKNDLKHTKGVLSMARTSDPNSASSQFFIMHADSPHLDGQYAAFGKITSGLEIVDEIATTKTTTLTGDVTVNGTVYKGQQMSDVPEKPIVIKTIEVIK